MIIDGCAFCLIFLFVYAATAKLLNLNLFLFHLETYPWIRHLSMVVGWGVPLVELGVAGLLLSGKGRLAGFYASLALMIVFTVYLVAMLNSGSHLPCSCGGVIQSLSWHQHIWFNCLFILIAGAGLFFHHHKNQVYET